jgi:hypothetical protein
LSSTVTRFIGLIFEGKESHKESRDPEWQALTIKEPDASYGQKHRQEH